MVGLRRWLVAVWCAALVSGCTSTDLVGDNCINGGMRCTRPGGGPPDGGRPRFDHLDLLVVIDNTTSMATVQQQLAQWLPDLVRALLSGDIDADGRQDFMHPVQDVRLAVVSSDMGAPGIVGIPGCGVEVGRPLGDDGIFLNAASSNIVLGASCAASTPFLEFDAITSAPNTLEQQAGCRAFVGTDGCSYPMPLEAALKALWDRNDLSVPDPVTFLSGVGHGIATQPGFIRDDALLGIIVVTDDDDCSMSALNYVDPSQRFAYRRCLGTLDHAQKFSRYRDGFGALKGGKLDFLFFGVIAGVPTDLANDLAGATTPDERERLYNKVLEDERMAQSPDPMPIEGTTDVRKSCGDAYPPQRLVEFARQLGGQSAVGSICDELSVPMRTMTTALARLIDPDAAL